MEVLGYTVDGLIEVTLDSGDRCFIPDDMGNRDRRQVYEWEFGPPDPETGEYGPRVNTIPPYTPPQPDADAPYRLFKSIFINRLTEAEAATMEAVLAAAEPKLRLMFNSVEYFVSDDPLFATMHAAVAAALGETRADELLAPDVPPTA
jgi:hypothetical protein